MDAIFPRYQGVANVSCLVSYAQGSLIVNDLHGENRKLVLSISGLILYYYC